MSEEPPVHTVVLDVNGDEWVRVSWAYLPNSPDGVWWPVGQDYGQLAWEQLERDHGPLKAASEPSSLRAELAEARAKAEIAELERDLRLAEGHLLDMNAAFEQKCNKLAAQSDIVEAAKALVDNGVTTETYNALVAAVEEGNKT